MGKPQTGREILDEVNESVKKQMKTAKQKDITTKAKVDIETIKTWTIVVLVGFIAVAASYLYAFNQGASAERAKAEQVKTTASLKQ